MHICALCGRARKTTACTDALRPVAVISLAAIVGRLHPHQREARVTVPAGTRRRADVTPRALLPHGRGGLVPVQWRKTHSDAVRASGQSRTRAIDGISRWVWRLAVAARNASSMPRRSDHRKFSGLRVTSSLILRCFRACVRAARKPRGSGYSSHCPASGNRLVAACCVSQYGS